MDYNDERGGLGGGAARAMQRGWLLVWKIAATQCAIHNLCHNVPTRALDAINSREKFLFTYWVLFEGMCQGSKPGTGKLYTDVCLCCSAHTSGCVVDGLGAMAAF